MKRHLATSWRAVAAVVLGIAGALAGCNIVVDAGAYHVVYGVDGSAPGTDGSVVGLEGGTVGMDGGTHEGGGNASCGSTPLPTSQAFQQLVSACVLSVSCDPQFFSATVSDCITNDYLATFGSLACLASITSCADFYNCNNYSVTTTVQCPDTSSSVDDTHCNGNIATNCYYSEPNMGLNNVYDCTALAGSGTCTVYTDDNDNTQAGCELGTCTDTDSNNHCLDSSHIYTCVDGLAYGTSCPQASTCGTISGSTACYYNATACSAPSVGCTSAGALTECVPTASNSPSAYQVQNYNCAAAGLSCETDDAGGGQCVSPGCEQSTCVESCDSTGTILTVCVGGLPLTYNCVTNGFTGCTSMPNGSSTTYNYCYY
jgi:hypothetical protein